MTFVKAGIDVAGVWVVVGAIAGVLPAVGALLAVIWYCFQIWESTTFQKIVGRLSQFLSRKQAKKALDAGAPLVVLQAPPVPTDAVVVVQPAPSQSQSGEGPTPATPA